MPELRFDAVLFDLLTALLDSWTLWNKVAGSAKDGHNWRAAYLRRTYETGAYRPYEALVAEAAIEVGLSPTLAAQLAARYDELKPWPEMREVLGALRLNGLMLGIVTNCSDETRGEGGCLHRHRIRCRRDRRAGWLLQAGPAALSDGSR
jgi:FMN phosphatase YigB (HAD superfamily)